MIYFNCPECDDELEGPDSLGGERMECPACEKEIEVPRKSSRKPSSTTDRGSPRRAGEPKTGSRFVLIVLLVALVGALVVTGVGWTVNYRAKLAAEENRSPCATCAAEGKVTCTKCFGKKVRTCTECKGSGKRLNFRDQEEVCYVCSGQGILDCQTCGGRGEYACARCHGTGRMQNE